jgi:hypothetical protein
MNWTEPPAGRRSKCSTAFSQIRPSRACLLLLLVVIQALGGFVVLSRRQPCGWNSAHVVVGASC